MSQRRVLLTGAAGYIARQLLPAFRIRYDLILLDAPRAVPAADKDEIQLVDLANRDLSRLRRLFAGVDTVVHTAHHWDDRGSRDGPDHLDNYYNERGNIDMAYHVCRLAFEEGVRRVVVASSNHATDWYENLIASGGKELVDERDLPYSDRFYGWAKTSYELLGFLLASGRLGRQLENVQVRIGAPRPILGAPLADNPAKYKRDLACFISERDLQQLFVRAIETEDIRNRYGIPFQVVYGVSNNTRRFWSLVNARRTLGYQPVDDSEILFADEIRQYLIEPELSRLQR